MGKKAQRCRRPQSQRIRAAIEEIYGPSVSRIRLYAEIVALPAALGLGSAAAAPADWPRWLVVLIGAMSGGWLPVWRAFHIIQRRDRLLDALEAEPDLVGEILDWLKSRSVWAHDLGVVSYAVCFYRYRMHFQGGGWQFMDWPVALTGKALSAETVNDSVFVRRSILAAGMLAELEDHGLVTPTGDGEGKRYVLTPLARDVCRRIEADPAFHEWAGATLPPAE